MNRFICGIVAFSVVIGPGVPHSASAQAATASRPAAGWIVAGAAGGFGLGLVIGLSAFDDSVNSDRKVWTTAAVGAGLGGVAGYLIARARHRKPTAPAPLVPGAPGLGRFAAPGRGGTVDVTACRGRRRLTGECDAPAERSSARRR